MNSVLSKDALKRLVACLAGSVVLAMMVGNQEGSTSDYSYGFRKSVLEPRIVIFLAIGVLLFFAMTYWRVLAPFITRPGFWPLISGLLAVVAAQTLMDWFDPVGDSHFSAVADAVSKTPGISWTASWFFGWLAWTLVLAALVLGIAAIVLTLRPLAWFVAALSVFGAVISVLAHKAVVDRGSSLGVDHSLGYAAAMLGWIVVACAMVSTALTPSVVARGRAITGTVLNFRPGLPLVLLGIVVAVLGSTVATWFSPGNLNLDMSGTRHQFVSTGTSIGGLALDDMGWLTWVLIAVAGVVALAACWLRNALLALAGALIGAAGTVITLVTLYQLSDAGAKAGNFDARDGTVAEPRHRRPGWRAPGSSSSAAGRCWPCSAGGRPPGRRQRLCRTTPRSGGGAFGAPGVARTAAIIAMAAALFYPPMATPFWQQVLVTEIGISILLAVGLNVVVGWAGLLDLGFIAFYAIGSYTTAYLTDALPVKPPSFLHLSPLWAIPFAVVICLLAGLLLGAPTLRLRGDYLAIVTLGFGEIIRIIAVNADGFTRGSQGPDTVPNPVIKVGPVHLVWGLNQLQYWYLLLVIFVIVVLAFRRLEHSRLGRAWAAVREDEVAAQSTGINTTRVKLLAFAIGASTSGIAGVFFASQVGAFTPDNFVLQNSILIVAYVVFGGMGSLPGAMAGAAMLTWLPRFLQDEVPQADKTMWIGAVVLLMMIFRPEGLVPARRRRIEMHEAAFDTPAAETAAVPDSGSLGLGPLGATR